MFPGSSAVVTPTDSECSDWASHSLAMGVVVGVGAATVELKRSHGSVQWRRTGRIARYRILEGREEILRRGLATHCWPAVANLRRTARTEAVTFLHQSVPCSLLKSEGGEQGVRRYLCPHFVKLNS